MSTPWIPRVLLAGLVTLTAVGSWPAAVWAQPGPPQSDAKTLEERAMDIAMMSRLFQGKSIRPPLFGLVNVRNGNYFLPQSDFVSPEGALLGRAYNSRAERAGPFGHGWSFTYGIQVLETALGHPMVVEADGSEVEYVPEAAAANAEALRSYQLDRLIALRREEDRDAARERTNDFYRQLREQLRSDGPRFYFFWATYAARPPASPRGVRSASAVYAPVGGGGQRLERRADGTLLRILPDGSQQLFNAAGILEQVASRSGEHRRLVYAEDRLAAVELPDGRRLAFAYRPDGTIKSASWAGSTIHYEYDRSRNLEKVLYPDGATTRFNYDRNHNLTSATLRTGETVRLTYEPKSDWVIRMDAPDGRARTYQYVVSPTSPNESRTLVHDSPGPPVIYDFRDDGRTLVIDDGMGWRIRVALPGAP